MDSPTSLRRPSPRFLGPDEDEGIQNLTPQRLLGVVEEGTRQELPAGPLPASARRAYLNGYTVRAGAASRLGIFPRFR